MDLRDSQDWGLAVFAYRGFDGSDGETNYVYLARDALTILTGLCRNERLAESRVHLVGFSIGGHLATLAARDARANGKPAKSLTLFASVSDVEMLPRSRVSSLVNGENYLTLPILDEVSAPVLVLQGTADEALNGNSQGRAIAKRLGNRAQYQEFLGVGHQALLFHEAALSMTRTFVQAHLE
jgi:pimeloyl-ACP methyl ester carboxylesterase